MTPPHDIGQRLLLAFKAKTITSEVEGAIRQYRPAGITLFRSLNIDTPSQLRALTDSLQQLAKELELPPLLIAADQEGGQLMAAGDATPLPGTWHWAPPGLRNLPVELAKYWAANCPPSASISTTPRA